MRASSVSRRLTLSDAIQIHSRRRAGEAYSRLAAAFDVNPARIAEVLQGKLFPEAFGLAFPSQEGRANDA